MLNSFNFDVVKTFLIPIIIYLLLMIVAFVKEKCFSFDIFIYEFLRWIPLFLGIFSAFVVPGIWESGVQTSLKICLYIAFAFLSIVILLFWHYSEIDKNN